MSVLDGVEKCRQSSNCPCFSEIDNEENITRPTRHSAAAGTKDQQRREEEEDEGGRMYFTSDYIQIEEERV
jgi:hypothetical protein